MGENGTFSVLQKISNTHFCRIFACVIIPRFCWKVMLKNFVCRKVIPNKQLENILLRVNEDGFMCQNHIP